MDNITIATFLNNEKSIWTEPLTRIDYGQYLQIEGLELPISFEVHFSLNGEEALPMIGSFADGVGVVQIPDELLQESGKLAAYIYLHTGENDGETVYTIQTRIAPRPGVSPSEPTPVQQDIVTQAIAALQSAVEITDENVETTNENVRITRSYRNEAESFKNAANTAAYNAETSECNAKNSEINAADSESKAHRYRNESEGFRDESEHYANLAEQCAKDAGYLWFYIERGKLYMERTENTEVTFYMENGKLYVKEATA